MRARLKELVDDESGFTLVELAVAMPIMLIVVGGMIIMLTTLTHYNSQNQEKLTLQTEARSALNKMETEIRGAFYGDGVTTPISAGDRDHDHVHVARMSTRRPSAARTLSTFHLQQISYQVSNKLLQRQFKTSSNVVPGRAAVDVPRRDELVDDRRRLRRLGHEHRRLQLLHPGRLPGDAADADVVPARRRTNGDRSASA